jgi:hypothetical protein
MQMPRSLIGPVILKDSNERHANQQMGNDKKKQRENKKRKLPESEIQDIHVLRLATQKPSFFVHQR